MDSRLRSLVFVILPGLSIAADLATKTPAKAPTFAKDVAPIFQEKCQACHRAGSMAPMSLVTYEETRPWVKDIKQRVVARNMPPWHLDKTVGIQHFQNDISLTDEQISTIARWVDAGAPLGDPKDMPAAEAMAARRRLAARQAVRSAGSDHQVGTLHHAGARTGRVVQAAHANPADRAPLGSRGGDAAVDSRRPQDHAPRSRVSAAGGAGPEHRCRPGHLPRRACSWNGRSTRTTISTVPTPESFCCPARASGGRSISTQSARRSATTWSWRFISIPKGEEPKYRTTLTLFSASPGNQLDIPPNTIAQTEGYQMLQKPGAPGEFPAAHAPARQVHAARSAFFRMAPSGRSATSIISTSTG